MTNLYYLSTACSTKCHRYCSQLQKPYRIENAQQTESLIAVWWSVSKIPFSDTDITEGHNPHIIRDSVTTLCQRPNDFTVNFLNLFSFSSLADCRLWCFHAQVFSTCTPIVRVTLRKFYCSVCCLKENVAILVFWNE